MIVPRQEPGRYFEMEISRCLHDNAEVNYEQVKEGSCTCDPSLP